jgi:hypothetical protein
MVNGIFGKNTKFSMKKHYTKNIMKLFKKQLATSLLGLTALLANQEAQATHAAGADLTYSWISGNSYEVTATFYRDCAGVDAPSQVQIDINSPSCQYSNAVFINRITPTGQEITFPCLSATTTCNGGSSPGIQQYVYRGTVQLPAACSDYVLSYAVLARNCAINTIVQPVPCNSGTSNAAIYVEARLNNIAVSNNSSPLFSNVPLAFVCLQQGFTYNHGVVDPDGDSLAYELVAPKTSATTDVNFLAGYNATNPISTAGGFNINSNNGDLNFTPVALEVGIVAVRVNEYRNGVLIGSVIRDMQIYTRGCNNTLPTASGIDNTNNFTANVCPGSPLCFDIFTADADQNQSVTITWNNAIANATFSSDNANRPRGTFCWTPTINDVRPQPYTFTVTVRDNACPLNGVQTYSYSINVNELDIALTASNPTCGAANGTVSALPLSGTGPYSYSWLPNGETASGLSGLTAGFYQVSVSDANGCSGFESVMLTSQGSLQLSTSSTNATCAANDGSATVVAAGGSGSYAYLWSNGGSTSTISNLTSGTYTVTVSDGPCSSMATVMVNGGGLGLIVTNLIPATCLNEASGGATVVPTLGESPYTYSWSPVGGNQSFSYSLVTGTYIVAVSDYNNCTDYIEVQIPYLYDLPNVELGPDRLVCEGDQVVLDAGNGFVSYIWNDWSTNQTLNVTSDGLYEVLVEDGNGCQNSDIVNVSFYYCAPTSIGTSGLAEFVVYPNPATSIVNIQSATVITKINLFDLHGRLIKSVENIDAPIAQIDLSSLAAGLYTIEVNQSKSNSRIKISKR